MLKKIGFLVMAHPDYINDGLASRCADAAAALIEAKGASVIRPADFICDHKQALSAALKLHCEDVDGVVIFLASWVECPTVMAGVTELLGYPMALWGFPMMITPEGEQSTGSYVSFAMLRGSFERISLPFTPILAAMDSEEASVKVEAFVKAAAAKKKLSRSRIGLIGYTSMTIYPGTFDHLLLRSKIGPEVIHSDAYSLIRRAKSQTEEAIDAACAKFEGRAKICCDVAKSALRKAAGLYCGLVEMKEEQDLDAVNAKCQYEFSKEYGMTLCTPLSLAADDKFVTSCEGDILCTVSMMILQYLTGQEIGYGDAITSIPGGVKLSPCGFMPYGIASDAGCEICDFMPGVGFCGIQNRGVMKPGEVTCLRLVEEMGSYHMLVFRGRGRADTKPRQGYMPALDIDLDFPTEKLEERYSGQHFALCYGDVTGELKMLAGMLDIGIEIL